MEGLLCDQCKYGFFNLDDSDPDGCMSCGCEVNGTIAGSVGCNDVSGQCECKANVTGKW